MSGSRAGSGVAIATLALALGLSGCTTAADVATDSATGTAAQPLVASLPKEAPRVIAPPTAADREHDRLVASYGGAYKNPATERYLDDLVDRLAAQSDRPDIPYKLTILNSSSVNAFALPSGRIYVTRGLLALANDDAEIAAVIAHEMAHVSARHAIARADMEKQSVLVSSVMTDVLHKPQEGQMQQAKSLVTIASFSRLQELEADQIGVRTIARAGFDPYGAARFLASMSRQVDLRGNGSQPNANAYDFLNTHPSTPERIQRAIEVARQYGAPGTGRRDKVSYLQAIDGLTYGEDPTQGFMQGRAFLHPRLGFTFVVPQGFTIDNTPQAILGVDGGGRALRLDTVKPKDGQSLVDYLSSGWIEGVDTGTAQTLTINGFEAATAVARGEEWSFRLYAIRFGASVYRMIFAARDLSAANDTLFQQTASTFRRLTPEEIGNVKPLRIDVTTVRAGDTPATLSVRMAYADHALDRFLILNGLDANATLQAGDRVKIISE
ncbi:M48 family metalloprotease [Labrys wisconsinensis]|uniref:Zn-dependent protease n=1 Tax=Labrys wisconsinensis TaxID=425677 RepID=A0ABU0JMH8_9HYPH|nr:M48 family metalloprotease [Labrys wisconsinensis]MDQ0474691.1 putative Zn-dependent protease [Labrys wisconsinensis]